MWFPSRSVVLLVVSTALIAAGCGFVPLHHPGGGSAAADLAMIQIEPIEHRSGQVLYNYLRDRLNPNGQPSHPAYTLSVGVVESQQSLGVRVDESATRANLRLTANFSLRSRPRGEEVFSGKVDSTSSFNILRSDFATLVAESDARSRGLRQISDEIRTRLAIYLGRRE